MTEHGEDRVENCWSGCRRLSPRRTRCSAGQGTRRTIRSPEWRGSSPTTSPGSGPRRPPEGTPFRSATSVTSRTEQSDGLCRRGPPMLVLASNAERASSPGRAWTLRHGAARRLTATAASAMTRDSSGTRSELARTFEQSVSQGPVAWLGDRPAELGRAVRVALGRLAEGERLFAVLRSKQTRPMSELRVLDLGCGDGGVCFGLAASGVIGRLVALDKDVNAVLRTVRRSSPSLQYVLARAEALPFPNGSFDVVICLGTFQPFPRPPDAGRNGMKGLSP